VKQVAEFILYGVLYGSAAVLTLGTVSYAAKSVETWRRRVGNNSRRKTSSHGSPRWNKRGFDQPV
jgi:hypothetical protein